MLVLIRSKREGFRCFLGDGRHIDVVLFAMERNRVRIGVIADKTIVIDRWENIVGHPHHALKLAYEARMNGGNI